MRLIGPQHLDAGMVRRLIHVRSKGTVAKVNLALDGPPPFTGVPAAMLAGRLVVAPSVGAVEGAFDAAKYGGLAEAPMLEIVVPSVGDPDLAPAGKHVVSINVIYAPYAFKGGTDAGRDLVRERVLAVLDAHAPGLSARVVAAEVLMPADIEARYRIPGGHWHHGELAIDQMLMLRPVHGLAQYATPIAGLYLAGAGSHPGGNVSGAPALNAARRILRGA